MVRFVSSDQLGRKHQRHSSYQTQRLEEYYKICQHPNERQRSQLGRQVGLNPTQIKFWFQNKRTQTKAQNDRLEGNALREENERMKCENLAMFEALNDGLCKACKGLSSMKEEKQQLLEQLQIENSQLNQECGRLSNLLATSGISHDASNESAPQDLLDRGLSLDREFCSERSSYLTTEYQLNEMQEFDLPQLIEAARKAIDELSTLMTQEPMWIKDPKNGNYIINRENYEKTFLRINHLKCSEARFESSKDEGIVRLSGPELVALLQNSAKRMDFFPTILPNARTIKEFGPGCDILIGALQMVVSKVYEQMHILSPLVPPRDFYFIRYCEQIDDDAWILVEVSYDLISNYYKQTSPFRSWRFPSGCLIKDMSNGWSKITWVEHVEVNDQALTHHHYRDLILEGLGYGADRWILTLQNMCDRFACQKGENTIAQAIEGATCMPEGRKGIMSLTHRMIKDLCAQLSMQHKMDMPQLSQINDSESRVNVYKSVGPGQPNGLIISVATSIWIPLSFLAALDFFTNTKKRHQWDALSDGNLFQEVANIKYGNDQGNCVSIIQPLNPRDINTLVVQESYMDPLGGMIVYAPVHTKFFDMVISGANSFSIPILPSGLIISKDGHPKNSAKHGGSSNNILHNGSLVTVILQITSSDDSSFEQLNALIGSTIRKIKHALSCPSWD